MVVPLRISTRDLLSKLLPISRIVVLRAMQVFTRTRGYSQKAVYFSCTLIIKVKDTYSLLRQFGDTLYFASLLSLTLHCYCIQTLLLSLIYLEHVDNK
jgi:hypothetical protein